MPFGKTFRGAALAAAALVLTGALGAQTAAAKDEVLVYTAIEADELAGFKEAFEAEYPDVDIKWVRDSTGIITAKLLAEKDNPAAERTLVTLAWNVKRMFALGCA